MYSIDQIRERLKEGDRPKADEVYAPDWELAKKYYHKGRPRGLSCEIPEMEQNFSWKKGFLQCFTGWPNFGKTGFTMHMMLIMSIAKGWKWVIWSPEMMDSIGGVKLTANDIFDQMAHSMMGKNPDRYYNQQPSLEEYQETYKFLTEHFKVIYPHKRSAQGILDMFVQLKDSFDFQGVLLDPFKSLHHDTSERWDIYLERTFDSFKTFATESNTIFNLVAHPNSLDKAKIKDKTGEQIGMNVCDQFMLSGGSAWNNTMDAVFSIHRPNWWQNPQDPNVEFYSLKIRKQNLVGRTGKVDDIVFNIQENRYYFSGGSPLDTKPKYENNEVFKGQPNKFDEETPF